MNKSLLALIAGTSLFCSTCFAQEANVTKKGIDEKVDQIAQKVEDIKTTVGEINKRTTAQFAGIHFGVGIGFTQTFGRVQWTPPSRH